MAFIPDEKVAVLPTASFIPDEPVKTSFTPDKPTSSFIPDKPTSSFVPEKPTFNIRSGINNGIESAKQTIQKLPIIGGFTPEQITKGQQVMGEVIERPIAGLRGVSKEGLGGFKKGLLQPEKYPVGTFSESLVNAGMEPISAGALGTLADAGYYFGMPEALTRLATAGKVKLIEGIIKNVDNAILKSVGKEAQSIPIRKDIVNIAAKDTDMGTVLDAYLKSKNFKLEKTTGLLEYKPQVKAQPSLPLATKTPKPTPSFVPDPIPTVSEVKAPPTQDLKGETGKILTNQDLAASGVTDKNFQQYLNPAEATEAQYVAAKQIQYYNEKGGILPIEQAQEFYRSAKETTKGVGEYQHILRKGTDIEKLKKDGFKSGIGPNAILRWSGKPTDIMQMKYAPKEGDIILYIPKDQIVHSGNGPKIKEGFIPTDENFVTYSTAKGGEIAPEEIARVSKNILKNNTDVSQKDAEAMAKDVIQNKTQKEVKTIPATKAGQDYLSKPDNPLKTAFLDWAKIRLGDDYSGFKLSTYTDGEPYFNHPIGTEVSLRDYLSARDTMEKLSTKKKLTDKEKGIYQENIKYFPELQTKPTTSSKGGKKKQYIAIVDQSHPTMKDKFWMSNQIKGLTEAQAKPLLEKGKIREVSQEDTAPKKFVDIVEPDGTTKRMTWGEYLKYKNTLKQPPQKTGKEGYIIADMLNPAKWDEVRQFIEDDWIRVKRLIQQKGANVTDTNNPYEAEIRYWGRIGARTEEADRLISTVDKNIVTTAKKLNIPDKLLNKEIDRFLIARHAPERNAQHGENAAGMTDKQAFEIRAEIAGKPYAKEVERIADEIQTLNNKTLDILLEGEVIDKELYDKLRTMYKNHIPLNRVMSEEDDIVEVLTKKGFDVQGAGLKRAKGSELEIADILTNVTANYKAAIVRSEKNIVDNYTLKFARENEYFDGLFEEVKLPMLPIGKVQHRAAVDSGYLAQVKKFAESLGAKVVTGGQPNRVLGTYGGKTVERKFATPEEVVSHEVGHFLDDKYKLKQQFYKKGDTKKVGEEIYKFMVDQGQSANRVKQVSERFAHAFEWWLSNRALAKEDLPLFTKAIEDIISGIPKLSPLLKIRPTPGLTVESIEEMVFARQKYNTDPKVLPIREKGKQVYLKINDAQLAMALRGVNRQKVDGLMRGVKAFTRFYSGLMTRFNPEFVVSNKIRDLQEVAVYLASKNEIGVKGTAEAIIKDPQSLKDITDAIMGKDTEGARLYRQMKMDGGTTGGMGLSTREQLEIDINRIRAINRSSPRKAAEIILRSIDNWNTIFEDSSRLSVYRQALKQGVSRNKAAVYAKEASVNFNKMGTGSPILNALYMFSNASVQGTAKMLRAMRNPKVLATVLTLLGGAVFLVNEYNDKKDKDWRKKVSKWDRLNGLNIVISTDKGIKYVTIPISWGLKPIKVFFDSIGDISSGFNKSVPEAVSNLVASTVEAYNPAGGTDIVSTITPSILDLPVDIARNRSWTGGKIRPDWNNSAPASIQYFDSLRKKLSGQKFIETTKELGDKGIEISPADLNYAFEQLIGGTGRAVTKTLNTIVGVAQGKPQAKEIPFVSRFYRDIPEEEIRESGKDFTEIKRTLAQQDKNRFYLGQEAELAWNGMKQIPLENRKEHYTEIRKSNPILADKIKDIAKEEQANLTYNDRLIKKLGVENGERSKYLWNKISKIDGAEERKSFYLEMKTKNVITDEVARQIKIRAKR